MIYLPRRSRPAIIVDDRLPYIEYEPETLHSAEVVTISGIHITDDDYRPLPGGDTPGDTAA